MSIATVSGGTRERAPRRGARRRIGTRSGLPSRSATRAAGRCWRRELCRNVGTPLRRSYTAGVRIRTRTVTAFLVAGVIAAGCGVQAKSDRHAAGVCDSVEPLVKTKRSLDALDRKSQNSNRGVTSPKDLRRLSRTYRAGGAAYS